MGLGGSDWRLGAAEGPRLRQVAAIVLGALPVVALLVSALLLVGRHLLAHGVRARRRRRP